MEKCIEDAVAGLQVAETQSGKVAERDELATAWRELLKNKAAWSVQYPADLLIHFKANAAAAVQAAHHPGTAHEELPRLTVGDLRAGRGIHDPALEPRERGTEPGLRVCGGLGDRLRLEHRVGPERLGHADATRRDHVPGPLVAHHHLRGDVGREATGDARGALAREERERRVAVVLGHHENGGTDPHRGEEAVPGAADPPERVVAEDAVLSHERVRSGVGLCASRDRRLSVDRAFGVSGGSGCPDDERVVGRKDRGFDCVEELGIHYLRYGPPLHRTYLGPGRYDWDFADMTLADIKRRDIVPIVDLRCRFGQGMTEATPMHVVIIVQVGARQVGLLADRVLDIVSIDPSRVQPVPRVAQATQVDFLSGLVTIESGMIALVDLPHLLAISDSDPDKAAA